MSKDQTKDGSLLLNGTETIINFDDSAFGVDYRVKPRSKCYLFSALPDMVNVEDVNGVLQSINGPEPYPATFTDSNNKSVGVLGEIKPQQLMLARTIPMHPELMEVVIYESAADVDPTMPETGDEITVLQKGYVATETIRPLASENAKFVAMNDPLFPNQSLLQDIRQYRFGDCFLLSSMLAILAKENGENFIRSMMVQDGDATIVKLFHPVTKEPQFIRVKNTSYHAYDINYNKHRAPWVHVLEKAYTAFAFINDKAQSFPAFKEIFGNGGLSKTALTILTGQDSKEQVVPDVWENTSPIHYFSNNKLINLDANSFQVGVKWSYLCQQFAGEFPVNLALIEKLMNDSDALQNELNSKLGADNGAIFNIVVESYRQFIASDHPLHAIIHSLSDYIEIYNAIYKQVIEKPAGIFDQESPIETMADVYLFVDNLAAKKLLPAKFTQRLFEYAQANSAMWTNPNRSDYYTPELNQLYENIKSDVSKCGTVATASTKAKFAEKVPGLRNRHAYAVIGTEERETNGVMHKYIILRNPWGRVGRGYADELDYRGLSAAPVEIEQGSFALELTDFQRYFRAYTTSTMPIVQKEDLVLSNLQIGTKLLYEKVEKIRTACEQFKKDLRSKLKNADSDQQILTKQLAIIENAESKISRLNEFSTHTALKAGINHFQSVIFDKQNMRTIQKSNDSAGVYFLQVVATILSLGILYNRFFNRTHQKTFLRELNNTAAAKISRM